MDFLRNCYQLLAKTEAVGAAEVEQPVDATTTCFLSIERLELCRFVNNRCSGMESIYGSWLLNVVPVSKVEVYVE